MNPLQHIFREAHKIHTYHVDFEQKITIPGIFLFLQEIAWHHANEYGFGFSQLQEKGLFWVLSKIKLVMHRYPLWNDVLHLETWSKEPELLTAFRDYEGFDQDQNHLFSATSAWHVLSAATQRPQRLDELRKLFSILEGKHAIEEKPEKLPDFQALERSAEFPVLPSDIDMNLHVNHTRYITWMLDHFGFEFLQQHQLEEIEVNFLWPAVAGDRYFIATGSENGTTFGSSIIRSGDQKELARIRTAWRKK